MTPDVRLLVPLCAGALVMGLVSACGGKMGDRDAEAGGQEAGGGVAGAGGQRSTEPIAENIIGSWLLTELRESGQTIPLESTYTYTWKPDHPEVKLNYLVFTLPVPDTLNAQGLFYMWSVDAILTVDGSGGCAFPNVSLAEYPPFGLIAPLPDDYCPDACWLAHVSYENVLRSVVSCELSDDALTLANEDGTNAVTYVASEYDLSAVLN